MGMLPDDDHAVAGDCCEGDKNSAGEMTGAHTDDCPVTGVPGAKEVGPRVRSDQDLVKVVFKMVSPGFGNRHIMLAEGTVTRHRMTLIADLVRTLREET